MILPQEQTKIAFDRPMPIGVRMATRADEIALHTILMELYRDNYLGFSMDDHKVWDVIRHCCRGEGGMCGIIEEDGVIVATTGVVFSSFWYSTEQYLSELWFFVLPDARPGNRHADSLADWLHWLRDQIRDAETGRAIPLVTSVTSYKRLEAKMRWWGRWAKLVGGIFVIDGA